MSLPLPHFKSMTTILAASSKQMAHADPLEAPYPQRYCAPRVCWRKPVSDVDRCAVFEREANRPVSVDGGVVDEDMPDAGIELDHGGVGVDADEGL